MRRTFLFLSVAALTGCGSAATQPGASIHVAVERLSMGDDCVVLEVSDASDSTRREVRQVSLSDRPARTEAVVGVVQPEGWGALLKASASLHLGGCGAPAADQAAQTFQVGVPVVRVDLLLRQPGAGTDAGSDAGTSDAGTPDAGTLDAGTLDAGDVDAGGGDAGSLDAGAVDAGAMDAGVPDAGVPDAGSPDAGGVDAGTPDGGLCTGAVRAVRTTGPKWTDLAVFSSQGVIAVGDGDSIGLFTTGGTFADWSGGTCTGNFAGVWVRPTDFQPFVVSSTGLARVDGPRQCTPLPSPSAGTPQALAGIRIGGTTRLYVPTVSPATVVELDVGQPAAITRTPPSAGAVYDVDGVDEDTLFAVGNTSNGKGAFWRWNVTTQSWDSPATLSPANTPIYAVDVVSNVLAFAGGAGGLYRWNGVGWSGEGSPGFDVYGVRALSSTEVYVVGPAVSSNVGFARWNGTSFSSPLRPMSGSFLARVRGGGACSLWAVGDSGLVVTTEP
ncbi:MAG: hypothetical protein IT380_01540 [Myxococcales bacterium]|nr:hypothetical protein [Myxococcales bacterium]